MSQNWKPAASTTVHVWDCEVEVRRVQLKDDARWVKIRAGDSITVDFCFETEAAEATFFDSVAAADPRASE